jgi:hypothetical protein
MASTVMKDKKQVFLALQRIVASARAAILCDVHLNCPRVVEWIEALRHTSRFYTIRNRGVWVSSRKAVILPMPRPLVGRGQPKAAYSVVVKRIMNLVAFGKSIMDCDPRIQIWRARQPVDSRHVSVAISSRIRTTSDDDTRRNRFQESRKQKLREGFNSRITPPCSLLAGPSGAPSLLGLLWVPKSDRSQAKIGPKQRKIIILSPHSARFALGLQVCSVPSS